MQLRENSGWLLQRSMPNINAFLKDHFHSIVFTNIEQLLVSQEKWSLTFFISLAWVIIMLL